MRRIPLHLVVVVVVTLALSGCTHGGSSTAERSGPANGYSQPPRPSSATQDVAVGNECHARWLTSRFRAPGAALGTTYVPITLRTDRRCQLTDDSLVVRIAGSRVVERLDLSDRRDRITVAPGRGVILGAAFRSACIWRHRGISMPLRVLLRHRGDTVASTRLPSWVLPCRLRRDALVMLNRLLPTGPQVADVVRTVRTYLATWAADGPVAAGRYLVPEQRATTARDGVPRLASGGVTTWRVDRWYGVRRLVLLVSMELHFRGNRGAWNEGANDRFVTASRQPDSRYLLSFASGP